VASRVFAERGYQKTDVQVIADSLGMGKGTIYRYFSSKEALFLAAVDRGMRRLSTRLQASIDAHEEPLSQLEAVVTEYLVFFEENKDLAELIIMERAEFRDREKPTYFAHRNARRDSWQEALGRMITDGIARKDLEVEAMYDAINNLMYGTMFTNFFNGRVKSVEQQARELLDIYLQGILT